MHFCVLRLMFLSRSCFGGKIVKELKKKREKDKTVVTGNLNLFLFVYRSLEPTPWPLDNSSLVLHRLCFTITSSFPSSACLILISFAVSEGSCDCV